MTSSGALATRTFDAVLFDMDGTLINSIPAVVRSWLQWAQEYDIDPRQLVGMHGVPALGVISRLMPDREYLWNEAALRIRAIEVADTKDVVLLPGAVDALLSLPTGRAAIVTSCTEDLAEARIKAVGLPVPSVLVTAEQTPVGKPNPEPYLLGAELLGVEASRCLVVEDATSGVQAGRAAGAATLAVLTHLERGSSGADAEVNDLAALRFSVTSAGVSVAPA